MNRKRIKGENGKEDTEMALHTLFTVLLNMIEMMAPFTPFITEHMYQNMKKAIVGDNALESIHYVLHREVNEKLIDVVVERQVSYMQAVIDLGRLLRERRSLPVKYPLPEVVVITNSQETINDIESLKEFILNELNVREVKLTMDRATYGVQLTAEPDIRTLGLRLRGDSKKVIKALRLVFFLLKFFPLNLHSNFIFVVVFSEMPSDQLLKYQDNPDDFEVEGIRIEPGELRIKYKFSSEGLEGDLSEKYEADSSGGILVLLNVLMTEDMKDEGTAREIVNRVQKLRKEASLVPTDLIKVHYSSTGDLSRVCQTFGDFIQNSLKAEFVNVSAAGKPAQNIVIEKTMEIKTDEIELIIERLNQI